MAEKIAELNKNGNEVTRNWQEITSDVTSNNGYKAPHNMWGQIRGFLTSTGVYIAYIDIDGGHTHSAFTGYSNANYQINHYFYIRKGEVVKTNTANNLSQVTYYAIRVD